MKKIIGCLGVVLFLGLFFGLEGIKAEALETRHYFYAQDFEEVNPMRFWCSNGKYTVNFKGLTEEKAFSGKRSFNLDVTFETPYYFYWRIPFPERVPVGKEPLNFSGHILIGEESTGRVGLGTYVSFPPTYHTGNLVIPHWKTGTYKSTDGKWKLIEGDLHKMMRLSQDDIAKSHVWAATGDNISTYINAVYLHLTGRKGDRIIVYVDDIKIEGEVPADGAFKEEIQRRWAPAKERTEKKLIYWEDSLSKIYKSLSSLKGEKRKELEKKVNSLIAEVAKIREMGFINRKKRGSDLAEKDISSSIKEIEEEISLLKGN